VAREFLDVLAHRFTLITIDNRGTGKSDKPVDGYALANLAQDVCGVLDHLDIKRAHVLGYSMGGAIAQEFVCQFPARVAGLVLCATMCGGPRAVYARLSVLRVMRELDGLGPEEIARRIWKVTYAPHYLAQNSEKVERQMLREISSPTPLHAADLQFQAFSDFDCSLVLPDVRAPTLVMTGDLDELIPPGNSTIIAELIPGAELNVMRGYAHRVLWEAPEQCATLIDQFLIEVDEQRGPTGNQRAKSRSASSSDTSREVDLLATFRDGWWRSIGLLARWPVTMEDLAADFLLHSIQPAYFGRRPPLGDGKPIVVVPGGLSTIQQLRDIGRKPGARGFAFTRFPEDVQVDEQGWLVLDQGSGYLNHLGEKTDGENLSAPLEAMQKILEQQQLLAQGAAAEARAEPNAAKPHARAATSEARSSAQHSVEAQAPRAPVAEAAVAPTPKVHSAGRSEAKTAKHASREGRAAARVQWAERRTRPVTRVVRVARAPEEDFDEPMMPVRPWQPLSRRSRHSGMSFVCAETCRRFIFYSATEASRLARRRPTCPPSRSSAFPLR
jgi:pimeloyl-ACP methyl ester carboxylesterase